MFFRVKSAGSYQYLQIVHSVRQGEKVRQQVFGTLGRLDELKASGRLEALIRSGLRHCEKFALIDAHAAGETQAVTVQRIGPDLVFGRLWKECAIEEVIQSLLQARRYDFDVERAIYLTVLHRLFASGSDRAAERWREDYLIPGTEALDLHHLYRAMAFLGQEIESKGQKTLGTPRCLKDLIEEVYFPRKNGHVILGFFALLSKESGESVPRTPWVFSLCPCSGGDRPWAGGLPVGGRTRRLQGCIGARGASPQSSSLRCNIDSLG